MTMPGTIDCDIHSSIPSVEALLPYLPDHWREIVQMRGIDELNSISYPANSPLTARPDWRPGSGQARCDAGADRSASALIRSALSIAICNCLYGVQLLFSEDMAAAFARAVNDWMAPEMAGPGSAAARQHRRADPECRAGGGRDRALRQRSALRAGAAAGERRPSAGQAPVLADLRRGRAPWAADRHPCRQQLPQSADRGRLAELLYRGLCRPGAGLPVRS